MDSGLLVLSATRSATKEARGMGKEHATSNQATGFREGTGTFSGRVFTGEGAAANFRFMLN